VPNRWAEIRELSRVRVLLFLREPEAMFWVFAFPLILAAVLGFAFRDTEPANSKIAVVDGPGAKAMRQQLGRAENIDAEVLDRQEAERKLRTGAIDVLVEAGAPPLIRVDRKRAEAETGRLRVLLALGQPPRELKVEAVTEKGSRYIDFLFPGLLGMNLMGTGMWMVGFSIADLRQKKLLKRMLVTPMRRSSFLLSFMLARLAFLAMEVVALVLVATLLLDVPLRGSIVGFLTLSLFGAMVFAGVGLLVVSRAKTIQGASGIMNLVMMPMWLGSGVFFSYERFGDTVEPILRLLPLSALNDALRGVMLEGQGLLAIGFELGVMAAWGVACFLVALKAFRWQ
jgi:ABC-type multidrug transport system permease subunit